MQNPRKPPLTRAEKIQDFTIGFVGWWVINSAAWWFVTQTHSGASGGSGSFSLLIAFDLLMLPANVVALLILAIFQRYVALGVLATYFVNLLISAAIGMSLNGVCWYPYFVPYR